MTAIAFFLFAVLVPSYSIWQKWSPISVVLLTLITLLSYAALVLGTTMWMMENMP